MSDQNCEHIEKLSPDELKAKVKDYVRVLCFDERAKDRDGKETHAPSLDELCLESAANKVPHLKKAITTAKNFATLYHPTEDKMTTGDIILGLAIAKKIFDAPQKPSLDKQTTLQLEIANKAISVFIPFITACINPAKMFNAIVERYHL